MNVYDDTPKGQKCIILFNSQGQITNRLNILRSNFCDKQTTIFNNVTVMGKQKRNKENEKAYNFAK